MPAKLTQNLFIQKANKIHKHKYDYSKTVYNSIHTKIIIICPEHGKFKQTPAHHLNGHECSECGHIKTGNAFRKNNQYFLYRAKKIHKNKYDYSKINYINCDTNIIIICPKHGEFLQKPYDHFIGHGCTKCGRENTINSRKITQLEFINKAKKIHKNKYDYSKVDYKTCDIKIEIICLKHNKSFFQTPYCHLKGSGCPYCYGRISSLEEKWLNSLNIPNDKDHRQVNLILKNQRRVNVDGYDPTINTIYLFHGDYYHGNPLVYHQDRLNVRVNKTYKELYDITKEKEKWIIDTGYNLVTMWEYDYLKYIKSQDKKALKSLPPA